MGGAKTVDAKDLVTGGVLQCLEAATVGMPFEVWKTYMGTYRTETTMQAFKSIYNKGGVGAFWKGWQPKMVSFNSWIELNWPLTTPVPLETLPRY
jgi:hypothetical protein